MLFCIFLRRLEKTHVPPLWRFAFVLFLVVRDFDPRGSGQTFTVTRRAEPNETEAGEAY